MANNVTEGKTRPFEFEIVLTRWFIGIRNTTTVFDPTGLERVRLPRVIPYDGVLRTYAEHAALGQSWLREVNNGRFDNVSPSTLRAVDSGSLYICAGRLFCSSANATTGEC